MIAHVMGNAKPIKGRKAHAAVIQQMLSMFPDVHVHNDPYPTQFGSGDWITVITRITGTFTGKMTLPNGKVNAPTGKAFDLNLSTTARWEGDELIEEYVFWDSVLQAQQIGLADNAISSSPIFRAMGGLPWGLRMMKRAIAQCRCGNDYPEIHWRRWRRASSIGTPPSVASECNPSIAASISGVA